MIQNHKICTLHSQMSLEIRERVKHRNSSVLWLCCLYIFMPEHENLLPVSGDNTFGDWSFKKLHTRSGKSVA